MIYYQQNLFLLFTVCIVSLTLAINVQNMNDLQRNHLIGKEILEKIEIEPRKPQKE